jgi:hypothetical protein
LNEVPTPVTRDVLAGGLVTPSLKLADQGQIPPADLLAQLMNDARH